MIDLSGWTIISLGLLWLAAGLGLAWVFGGASRLGGPHDPGVERCFHDLPLFECGACHPEPLMRSRDPDHRVSPTELEAKAK